jgi:polyhydroxybutyrate depolymerase
MFKRTIAAWLAAAAMLCGCGSSTTGADPGGTAATTSSSDSLSLDDVQPSLLLPSGVSSFTTTLQWDGRTRTILYLRPTASSATKVPALVMLHYRGGTPHNMAAYTDVAKLVREHGIWVILPKGVDGSWSDDPVLDQNRTDDSGFLAQLINVSVSQYPLDVSRIYMTGFSKGGFMVERFACEHADKIAAASWVSATLLNTLRNVCAPVRPLPVLGIHGTADPKVPYDGETGVASAPDTMAFFAALDGCATPPAGSDLPVTVNDGTSIHLDVYGSCSAGTAVDFYTVNGGGHTWPDSPYPRPAHGPTTHNLDATETVWQFMQNYRLQ